MSTELTDGLYQIDGPAVPRFGIAGPADGQIIEVVYKILSFYGSREDCEAIHAQLITSLLDSFAQVAATGMSAPIVWWRHRPEVRQDPEDPGRWQFYARFDTTPALPDLFWHDWECPEGDMPRRASEVIG
jgi:hypothetical protein